MANYKRSGGNGIALKIYAAIVSILLAAAIVLTSCAFALDWVKLPAQDEPAQEQPGEDEAGGAVIGEGEESGISLTSALIDPADYADYGVNALAETAYTVTITPEPADAMDTYTWTCDNTQQIQLSPSSDTKSCTVSCTGAFGTQATITVASAVNPDITATITVDYVKRVESVSISYGADKIKFGDSETQYTVTATPVYGTGTITPNFTVNYVNLKDNLGITPITVGNDLTGKVIISSHTAEFEGTTFAVSNPYGVLSSSGGFIPGSKPAQVRPTESQLKTTYINAFIDAVTGTTSDGTLTISYSVSYNPESEDVQGSFSDTGTASLDVAFDVSGLVINASNLLPSDTGLVY